MPCAIAEQGWRWSQQLGLYLGIHQEQLRFFTPKGTLVPSPEETAAAERQRAEAAQQQAEAATRLKSMVLIELNLWKDPRI